MQDLLAHLADGLRQDRELLIGGEIRDEAALLRVARLLDRAAEGAGFWRARHDGGAAVAHDLRRRFIEGGSAVNFTVGLRRGKARHLADALLAEGLVVEVVRNPEGFRRQMSFAPLRMAVQDRTATIDVLHP